MNANTTPDMLQPVSAKANELMAAGYEWHEAHGLWFGGEGYKQALNADGTPVNQDSALWRKCGMLAYQCNRQKLPLEVLKSHAGFYIGTVVSTGDEFERGAPNTRESDRYWQKAHEAQSSLETGDWVQNQYL